jgi:ribonuclease BN (tRNA processing enzyme)
VVSAALIKHPGPSVGYRIEDGGRTLAYLPDHEPALGADLRAIELEWISGLGMARDADVLLHDGQYTRDEYDARIGWGHSTAEDAVTFAVRAGARRLVLFHHDPMHTDDQLEAMLADAEPLAAEASITVELAREGAVYEVR